MQKRYSRRREYSNKDYYVPLDLKRGGDWHHEKIVNFLAYVQGQYSMADVAWLEAKKMRGVK